MRSLLAFINACSYGMFIVNITKVIILYLVLYFVLLMYHKIHSYSYNLDICTVNSVKHM